MTVKFDFEKLGKGFERSWPVRVPVQLDDGKIEEQEFTAIFRKLTKEEDAAATEATTAEKPFAWLDARWVGLKDIELTPELRETMMGEQNVRVAIINAYHGFVAGIPAKN